MNHKFLRDLSRVQQAIREVCAASLAESDGFRKAFEERSAESWNDLYRLHLDEADAIHRLSMLSELMERHQALVARTLAALEAQPSLDRQDRE